MHSSLRDMQTERPEDYLAFYKSYADETIGAILESIFLADFYGVEFILILYYYSLILKSGD